MRPSPNAKALAPILEWAERAGAHHGGAHHQEAGALGLVHESPMAIVGGGAVAAGQHTLTTGLVRNFAEDKGGYSILMGEAIFEASAQSTEPRGALAAADTFLTVSGADFIFESESTHVGHGPNDAWASSELDYIAIDIKGWSPRAGPVVIDLPEPGHHSSPCGQQPLHDITAYVMSMADAHGVDSLSATPANPAQPPADNSANGMALAEAHGDGSLSATLTHALTVENQFSLVNATGMVAV
jgi:hypothetical protein